MEAAIWAPQLGWNCAACRMDKSWRATLGCTEPVDPEAAVIQFGEMKFTRCPHGLLRDAQAGDSIGMREIIDTADYTGLDPYQMPGWLVEGRAVWKMLRAQVEAWAVKNARSS